jgi:transcriptional regulator GlxA family with amidase domain
MPSSCDCRRVEVSGIIVTVSAKTAIVVYDGVGMFEFSVASAIFGTSYHPEWYRLLVCGPRTVTFDNGLRTAIPHRLDRLRDAGTVIVPPCEAPGGPPRSALKALREAHARGARLVSLCTGALVLAEAGLLDGRRATTHWTESASMAARYPNVTVDADVLYVDEGDILTSAGSAASIDLCLHLVRQDFGADIAAKVARDLVVPPYREGGQAQYIDTPLPAVDATDLFAETVEWAQGHLDEDISVTALATRSAMSRRTFARRFAASTGTTPYQWLLGQRLRLAQRLLETSDLTVDAVAEHSGFLNAGNLRKHFARSLHTTPSAYRGTFRPTIA